MQNCSFALKMLGWSDLERAIRFYTGELGLRVSGRFGDFVLFETGATTLALTGELAAAGSRRRGKVWLIGPPPAARAHGGAGGGSRSSPDIQARAGLRRLW